MKKIFLDKDWLPRPNEIGKDGKALPHFEDGGGAYKKRVFPQFTLENIKKKFNTDTFLDELIRYDSIKGPKYNKDIIEAIIKALNADEELKYAFQYDEDLPEVDLTLPAFTSGNLYNYLNKDLTFTVIFRSTTVILELSESFEICYGFLSSKKRKKNFLILYESNRDSSTDCYMLKEFAYSKYKTNISKLVNKELLSGINSFAPDTLVLNKDFKFDLKKIIKKLQPLCEKKRSEETEELIVRQKNTGTHIYLLDSKQINKEISLGRMNGSVLFSFPSKRGKPDFSKDAKLSELSKIRLKPYYFI